MDRYGLCTKTSKNGIINCKAVKSKPNDIQIFGYTHEIGEGEKSPDNPYQLVSLDNGNVNLYDANNITNIQVTNDGILRKGIIIESSYFKSKKCCIYFNLNESTGIPTNSVGINIKFLYKNGQYEVFKKANYINSPKRIEIADTVEKILIYEAGSGANGRYFNLYKNLTILDTSILPTETITEEHSITLTNNETTIQVPIPVQLRSVEGVSDYIFKDTDGVWKLMQNCQKYEFSGNEDCKVYENIFYMNDTIKDYQSEKRIVCTSNSYTGIENQASGFNMTSQINNSICFRAEPYNNTIYIKSTGFTTKNSFMSWLLEQYEVGTPLIMIYQLKIPIVHTLSNYAQELLNSFVLEKDNIISITDNAEFKIKGWIK